MARLPIRILIPLLVLLFSAAVGLYSFHDNAALAERAVKEQARALLTREMHQLQASMEYLLRKGDTIQMQKEIAALGADPTLTHALVLDENLRVIASVRRDHLERTAADVLGSQGPLSWPRVRDRLASIQTSQVGTVVLDNAGERMIGLYPLLLGGRPDEIRPTRIGIVLVARDLHDPLAAAARGVERQALQFSLYLALLAVALSVLFHFVLTRRMGRLMEATARFAAGELSARAALSGKDELAELGQAFDDAVARVADSQRRLAHSEGQVRLLLDSTAEGIIAVGPDGRCTLCNPSAVRLLGYEHAEGLVGTPVAEFFRITPGGDTGPRGQCDLTQGAPRHLDEARIVRRDGSTFWASCWSHPIRDGDHDLGVVITFVDITERKQIEAVRREDELRLRKQNELLVNLARNRLADCADIAALARELTELAARVLEVERLGLWLFDDEHRGIRCVDLFERSRATHSAGAVLRAQEYPSYFAALEEQRLIDAVDARSDPRTREFTEGYLIPNDIHSMLDATIRLAGRAEGVICAEHTGGPRRWNAGDLHFVGALADLVSVAVEAARRRQAQEALQRRLEMEEIISRISSRFINLPPEAVDEGIQEAIQAIAEHTGADRSYLFRFTADGRVLHNTHEYCAPGIRSELEGLQNLDPADFPWSMAQLRAGRLLNLPRVANLPDAAAAERERLLAQDIRSLLCVPLAAAGELKGFIGFDSVRVERTWDEHAVRLLEMIGQVVLNALIRIETHQALRERESQLSQAQAIARVGSWELDIATGVAVWSDEQYRLLGYEPQSVAAGYEPFLRAVHPGDRKLVEQAVQRALAGEHYEIEHRVVHEGGEKLVVQQRARVEFDGEGRPVRMIGTTQDITERKRFEAQIHAEKERLQVTLHSIGDAVITTDANGDVDYLNPIAEALTGWSNDEAVGQPLEAVFQIVNEFTGEPTANPVQKCLAEGRIVGVTNHTVLISRDGRRIAIEDSAAPIRDRLGKILGVVMVFHDVSKTRELTDKLSWQASHDALTGLLNRYEFENRVNQAIYESRETGAEHALIYFDLDQFKVVNDTCGHIAGDQLLKQLPVLLHQHVRETDMLARLGGDEFGLLLPHCGLEKGRQIADDLLQGIREFRFVWEDKAFELGASFGVVPITAATEDMSEVMRAADMACYAAKDRGRSRIHVYRPDDAELVQRQGEMQLVSGITKALEEDRFVLYRQDIQSLDGSSPYRIHFEVLVRMLDEDGGLIPPGAFIPAAERYNLMPAIDRWVIHRFLEMHGPDLLGEDSGGVLFSINLSGASLSDDDFMAYLRQALAAHRVPPGALCFEITETAAIANLHRVSQLIRDLQSRGCLFALDDFGSGLSSFGYLKNLPVDFLKIDGGFVKDMVDDPIDYAMVEAIARIGRVMGIQTIAEFVENDQIRAKLKTLGVNYAQGYGVARPQPLETAGGPGDAELGKHAC